ncbi:hypothetical protein MmiAt1_00860 [Methanimicrococcus sp. At1]|uniref:Uncharacterized protein n=1 Tax=Methanimicrococcus hacksteinii TaxID=3028293 RepID=A0ABU3VMD0_9EURY|nr:hypothetical protein [Methanimicrococcus sp. At1]
MNRIFFSLFISHLFSFLFLIFVFVFHLFYFCFFRLIKTKHPFFKIIKPELPIKPEKTKRRKEAQAKNGVQIF